MNTGPIVAKTLRQHPVEFFERRPVRACGSGRGQEIVAQASSMPAGLGVQTRTVNIITIFILGLFIGYPGPSSAEPPKLQRDMVLWYPQPAEKWPEAMPVGNGLMGAMVFGGTQHERIALNEGTFWSGRPHDYNNPDAGAYFPQIRDLVFAGKFQEAEKMANDHFFGVPAAQQAFQPLGDLLLTSMEQKRPRIIGANWIWRPAWRRSPIGSGMFPIRERCLFLIPIE
jgi:hypothetical protein